MRLSGVIRSGKSLALWGALALIVTVTGCASTKVKPISVSSGLESFPRPNRILVYDFAVSPDEVSLNSGPLARLRNSMSGRDQTEAELQVGREVAAALSEELVKHIRDLDLPAERVSGSQPFTEETLTIEGQFVSIDEGNRLRRMFVGFGLGNTEVKTLVQVYRGTHSGPYLVQEFETSAEGSKLPGMGPMMGVGAAARGAVGLATAAGVSGAARTAGEFRHTVEAAAGRTADILARHLAQFFAAQGWIPAHAAQ
jgi:Domain of unknown function (DUF4410)